MRRCYPNQNHGFLHSGTEVPLAIDDHEMLRGSSIFPLAMKQQCGPYNLGEFDTREAAKLLPARKSSYLDVIIRRVFE
jgi:hypothetical protein